MPRGGEAGGRGRFLIGRLRGAGRGHLGRLAGAVHGRYPVAGLAAADGHLGEELGAPDAGLGLQHELRLALDVGAGVGALTRARFVDPEPRARVGRGLPGEVGLGARVGRGAGTRNGTRVPRGGEAGGRGRFLDGRARRPGRRGSGWRRCGRRCSRRLACGRLACGRLTCGRRHRRARGRPAGCHQQGKGGQPDYRMSSCLRHLSAPPDLADPSSEWMPPLLHSRYFGDKTRSVPGCRPGLRVAATHWSDPARDASTTR